MTGHALSVKIERAVGSFHLDVVFEAGSGVTGIIGPSGAGKTMLLETIAGLVRPQKGRISLGPDVFLNTDARIFLPSEGRHIGYVFQEPRLFPHMSVAQNLDYGRNRRKSNVNRGDIVALLGLHTLLERYPHRLSGGEAARVSIGRALLSNPRLLLMDEPLANLDLARRREIMPYIEALHRSLDLPILFVSHNIDEITRLANRVIVLDAGRIVADGDVAPILNRIDIQSLILGQNEASADLATIIETRVESHDEADHLTLLSFDGGSLSVSRLNAPQGSNIRLRIHARDVAIATQRLEGISIRNVIEARITGLREAGPGQMIVSLSLGGGSELAARITTRSTRELDLKPGDAVWALIKSVALAV